MSSPLKNLGVTSPLVRDYLRLIVGEKAARVARLCSKKECTPEQISKRMRMKISHVRSLLNRMHTLSFVSYTKRINLGNNWVTYTWKVNESKLLRAVKESYLNKMNNVNQQLEIEQNSLFFSCANNCRRLLLEQAMEHDFRCPACGFELQNLDNAKTIARIEKIKCALLA